MLYGGRIRGDSTVMDDKTKKYREILDQLIVGVKESTIEEHEEPWRGWFSKNQIILQDIEKLKSDDNERSKISAFLLESQYIEFKIIDLLQELEILAGSDPEIVIFQGKKRKKELYELTLGQLHDELSKYNGKFLSKLTLLINELNKKRIRFAHYLFTSIQGIEEVIQQAKEGLSHNDKIIEELYLVSEYIDKNTWYGQMYERKRVTSFDGNKNT